MISTTGKGSTGSELPIDLAAARLYFSDTPAFLAKIEAVDEIRPLRREGAYLLTHHPVGGLGYNVVMVSCLQTDWHDGGMTLRPLDFELDKISSQYPTAMGFINGELSLQERPGGRTAVHFAFTVTVELPLVGGLKLFPRALVTATADTIMTFKVGLIVQSLFRKVLEDFSLEKVVPAQAGAVEAGVPGGNKGAD